MIERRRLIVRGLVQSIGFRPFVYRLASGLRLAGFVANHSGAVCIEIEGEQTSLEEFLSRLSHESPQLARIDSISSSSVDCQNSCDFIIAPSSAALRESVFVSADVATCPDCLAELFDPSDRRFGYPFLNCTNCGPRLTIVRGAPYDRRLTTMAGFEMCPACWKEYENPADRRFHAEPTACPICGPQLALLDFNGRRLESQDPLHAFAKALRSGRIGAVKGLGGYHLVCDARNEVAVRKLRRRKHREEMPLALMVCDIEAAKRLCVVSREEQQLLESPARPIVLLRRLNVSRQVANSVAPGNPYLGLMLPYTPLHHLLLNAMVDIPLVMTSGNRSHEPIAYEDDDAIHRLRGIAELFLVHNRPIHVRCDDSVTRIVAHAELPIRRSRGYAPLPIQLPVPAAIPLLAVGGQFKGVFGLVRDRQAFLSHHLGDLDELEATQQMERDIGLYEQVFQIAPQLLVHDLHPDYASTHYARRCAAKEKLLTLAVQHHHAHLASCMAENGLNEPVIGVTLDGTGYGIDENSGEATIWGGEFLVGDYHRFNRAAHLRNVAMPGGPMAIREPWRMALAHLVDANCDGLRLLARIPRRALCTANVMLARRLNSPLTSSMGRLFDAVAALVGVRDRVSFEGQAAMELEWLCDGHVPDSGYPVQLDQPLPRAIDASADTTPSLSFPLVIDTRPIVHGVATDVEAGIEPGRIARRFHSTVVAMIAEVCERIRATTKLNCVVLSGGVFTNALLTEETVLRLKSNEFEVYRHCRVPPNDGGICLGQLAIAAATCHNAMPAMSHDKQFALSPQQTPMNCQP